MRRFRRRREPAPGGDPIAGIAQLGERRNIGQLLRAFRRRDGEGAQVAVFDKALGRAGAHDHEVDHARDQRGQRRRQTVVGHMDAGVRRQALALQQHHRREMLLRRVAGAGEFDFAGPRADQLDQVGDRRRLRLLAHQQNQRRLRQQYDRREIGVGVVGQRMLQRGLGAVRARTRHNQRVAVRRRQLRGDDADNAADARPVVHRRRPAALARDKIGHKARYLVVGSARRIGHDHAHRPVGVGFRARRTASQRAGGEGLEQGSTAH